MTRQRFIWSLDGQKIAAMIVNHGSQNIVLGISLLALPDIRGKMAEVNEFGMYPYVEMEAALSDSARFQITPTYNWNCRWRDFQKVVEGWLDVYGFEDPNFELDGDEIPENTPVSLLKAKIRGAGLSGIYRRITGTFCGIDGYKCLSYGIELDGRQSEIVSLYRAEFELV